MSPATTANILGLPRAHLSDGPMAVHDLVAHGLPGQTLTALRARLGPGWTDQMLARALGVTPRTLQRRRDEPARPLSPEQGSRAWKFAELLTRAAEVLGDQRAAEDWLRLPQRGLQGRVPLDLLATGAGTEMVETLLGQMEYGVYV